MKISKRRYSKKAKSHNWLSGYSRLDNLTNNETKSRVDVILRNTTIGNETFKIKVSHLPTYNATIIGNKIVIPSDNIYQPKVINTKEQYRKIAKASLEKLYGKTK